MNTDIKIDSVTDRIKLIDLQKTDSNLTHLRKQALEETQTYDEKSFFFVQDEMLMHHLFDRKTNH